MGASWRELQKKKATDSSAVNKMIARIHRGTGSFVTAVASEYEDPCDIGGDGDKRRFTSPWGRKARNKDDDEGVRGPDGLRLLHHSPEPLIDLIFVHGLRGGSVKTWRKGNDPRAFWPQFWLPMEPGFENVNISTFGYDSDWMSRKTHIFSIHDFGQALFEAMRYAAYLRNSPERPIIMIGHSMGGLVIKKAFILAQDEPQLRGRIRTIFFLGTPHRGSNYAAILNNILSASGIMSSRHYISDLTKDSISAQMINDNFGKYAHEFPIFSFYETTKTSVGISPVYIVEKESAVLGPGFKNERVNYIHANHREICKYSAPDDPNYITIKNALAAAAADLLKDIAISKRTESKARIKELRSFLGVSDATDEYHTRVNGSCRWIDNRDDFQSWRDFPSDFRDDESSNTRDRNLSIYWIHANPGTGKTVLASHVISQLQESQLGCAYHYFHIGSKGSTSLGPFLRSIAYQMALSNSAIRDKLFQLCEEGISFDLDDSWTIWTKIFRKGILQSQVHTPQYLVVDAMDECGKYQEFFAMLRGERPSFPFRIFITSRNVHDIQRLQKSLETTTAQLSCVEIPVQDSLNDIQCYINHRIDSLPVDHAADRAELAKKILDKCNACFLWVRLVLDELENVYSSESMMEILEKIPEGMIPYYERTVQAMASNSREKHIAKAILMWTLVCARKLTIQELSQALKLDINTVLPSAKSAVEGLCGQLVTVDENSGVVNFIHPTAREFLLSDAAGEFKITKSKANERVALTCLQQLSGNELRPPRNPRFVAHQRSEPSLFLTYAMNQFSEHIYTASSENDDLLSAMDLFFKTNAQGWIERLAMKGELHTLIRASKNLKAYLERRAKYRSPLSSQVKNIDSWSTDLSRLVTRFGEALLRDPSSIYFLIPPLCPSGSALHRQFGQRKDGLSLVGSKSAAWDDCIAYVGFGEDMAASVSCGESLIAVGMESGDVHLYSHRSCQKEAVIRNNDPIISVHLTDGLIAVCTTKSILLRDMNGSILWENRVRFTCHLLTSSDDRILAVSQSGHLFEWDRSTGELLNHQAFPFRNYDGGVKGLHNARTNRVPQLAAISPDTETIALAYRGGTVCLWDIRAVEFIGWLQDGTGRPAVRLLFNPNPNINLLLIIYSDHGFGLYETWSGTLIHSHAMPKPVGVLSASCSPDGRTLATMDTIGNMHIWDFESLSLLYHIRSPCPSFRILEFTSSGSSVIDVMHASMRIWSPSVLVRKNMDEDASTSDDAIQLTIAEGKYESRDRTDIVVMSAHPTTPTVFAGKQNGEVIAFNAMTGITTVLYSHLHAASVLRLAASRNGMIASADNNGIVLIWELSQLKQTTSKGSHPHLRIHITSVKQLCFSADGDYLLVAARESDSVYRVKDGSRVGKCKFGLNERKTCRWLAPPRRGQAQEFWLLSDGVINFFSAESFPSLSTRNAPEVRLEYTLDATGMDPDFEAAFIDSSSTIMALEVRHRSKFVLSSTTFLYDLKRAGLPVPPLSDFSPTASDPITLTPLSTILHKRCRRVLGFSERSKSIVFLHKDSWVASVPLSELNKMCYTQHFFVPDDHLSSNSSDRVLPPIKTADDNIVFCLHKELISVKNGLRFRNVRTPE